MITIKASEFKTLVDNGATLEEICNSFKDVNGKALPKKDAKDYLKALNLQIKKKRVPRFTLVNDLGEVNTEAVNQ